MKMTSIQCTQEGCSYVAEHKREVVAKRMLGMHKRNAHGIVGAHAARNGTMPRKSRKALLVRATRVAEPRLESPIPVISEESILRKVLEEFAHCPKCGKNIQRLMIAEFTLAKHEQTH